jgi:hypothetical protein
MVSEEEIRTIYEREKTRENGHHNLAVQATRTHVHALIREQGVETRQAWTVTDRIVAEAGFVHDFDYVYHQKGNFVEAMRQVLKGVK